MGHEPGYWTRQLMPCPIPPRTLGTAVLGCSGSGSISLMGGAEGGGPVGVGILGNVATRGNITEEEELEEAALLLLGRGGGIGESSRVRTGVLRASRRRSQIQTCLRSRFLRLSVAGSASGSGSACCNSHS